MSENRGPSLKMWRPDVPLPQYTLPEGYKIRPIDIETEGDAWCACLLNDMGVGEVSQEVFARKMLNDKEVPDGSILVVENEKHIPVATATAQVKKSGVFKMKKEPWLHMVSVKESERGKGLGLPICTAVVEKHKKDGLKGCYLVTQDWREAAIYMYLKMGFLPVMSHESYGERWQRLAEILKIKRIKCVNEDLTPAEDIVAK